MTSTVLSRICLAALLLVFPLAGLAAPPATDGCGAKGWNSGTYTMDFNSITRTFRVHVPRGYDSSTPTPLVTYFHGWGGNENEIIGNRKVRSESDKRGYIVVAPRGLGSGAPDNSNNSWTFSGSDTGLAGDEGAICDDSITPDYSYPSCRDEGIAQNTCSWTHCQQNDVDFALALVDEVKANLCVDEDRVFAAGGSNGGMFAWELGQNPVSAGTFRAIAPLIGLPHKGYVDGPGKDGGLPVIVITGKRDKVVPPGDWGDPTFTTTSNGKDRYYYTGATAITEVWAVAHGCSIEQGPSPVDVGVRKADCRSFCSEDTGLPRVLDCRARMGHSYELNWSWKLILNFFDQHSS